MANSASLFATTCVATLTLSAFAAHADPSKPHIGSWGYNLSAMDKTVKPGDDFFHYANGSWLKRTSIAPDLTSAGTFIDLVLGLSAMFATSFRQWRPSRIQHLLKSELETFTRLGWMNWASNLAGKHRSALIWRKWRQ